MHIGRKQALFALFAGVAGMVPWISRKAFAQSVPLGPPLEPMPIRPAPAPNDQAQIDELKKRVASLEATLANQVAFTKDAAGNLTLMAPKNVTLNSAANLTLKASGQGNLAASGVMSVSGATLNLN